MERKYIVSPIAIYTYDLIRGKLVDEARHISAQSVYLGPQERVIWFEINHYHPLLCFQVYTLYIQEIAECLQKKVILSIYLEY